MQFFRAQRGKTAYKEMVSTLRPQAKGAAVRSIPMNKLRYGILGSGFMGRTHAEAIQHIDNAELIAVAGGSRAPGLAADYQVQLCASDAELIERDDIDAVIVTTPQY